MEGKNWKEKKSPKETAAGWNLLNSPCWRDPEGTAYTKGKSGNTIPQNTIQYKFKGPGAKVKGQMRMAKSIRY